MNWKIHILFLICCLGISGTRTVQAQVMKASAEDSIRISLLTCAAGGEIYTLFGHTAIRYENLTQGTDVVYNYGVFDFDTPNFALRFALGETDYQLARNDYRRFALMYAYEGRDIWQQTLNLKQDEKIRLIAQLEENYRPEHRIYRYNFFYDNCSTRPRDQIERAVDGQVHYAEEMTATVPGITFRKILHQYSEGHPWSRFAMDLCMGSKADLPINRRTMQFVPFNLQESFRQASIIGADGKSRPLVTEEVTVVDTGLTAADHRSDGITPLQCAVALWLVITGLSLYGLRRKKSLWVLDTVLFACAGIAGCIPAFLVLASQHPAVCPNYLLLVLHPFHLIGLPEIIRSRFKQKTSRYLVANLIVLTLFMLFWAVFPQRFPLPILFVALCLWERSISHVALGYKRHGLRAQQSSSTIINR